MASNRKQPRGLTHRRRYTLWHDPTGTLEIQAPIGWGDDDLEIVRNKKLHGVKTVVSNDLKFTLDGRDFINNVRDIYGINADLRMTVDEKNPVDDIWTRQYSGLLDLSTYSEENEKVAVKFNSSNLLKTIKSRQNEKVELDRLDTLDGTVLEPLFKPTVYLEGRKILLQSSLETGENEPDASLRMFKGGLDTKTWIGEIGIPLAIKFKSDTLIHAILTGATRGEEKTVMTDGVVEYMFYAVNDREKILDLNIQLNMRMEVTQLNDYENASLKIMMVVYKDKTDYIVKEEILIKDYGAPIQGQVFIVDEELIRPAFVLDEGESLSLIVYFKAGLGTILGGGEYEVVLSNMDNTLFIEEDSQFPSSHADFYLPHDIGNRLVEIMTDRDDAFYSEVLGTRKNHGYSEDGEFSLVGVMNGFQIRGFEPDPIPAPPPDPDGVENLYKSPTTSWKDFLETFLNIGNLGMGIEEFGFQERVRIEDLGYFYNRNVLIKIGKDIEEAGFQYSQVSDVKRSEAPQHYYSGLEFGYQRVVEYEEAHGLDEFNAVNTYTTNINRLDNVYNKTCRYRADGYGIEFARRMPFSDFSTEDTKYDKDMFLFDMRTSPTEIFQMRPWITDFEVIPTGVYDPNSAPNFRLTPFNTLLRHGWTFGAGLVKYPNQYVRYGSSEFNSKLTTQQYGKSAYSENGKIENVELDKARFIPEIVEFTHEVDFDLLMEVNGKTILSGKEVPNFYGLVGFLNERGQIEYGWLMNLKPNSGRFTLLKYNG